MELQRAGETQGHLLQIGVWHGKGAALLGLHASLATEQLVLVDELAGEALSRAALADVGVGWSEGMHHLSVSTEELLNEPLLRDLTGSFRWVHIGGERSFGAVSRELAAADKLLHDGGIACVDDFQNGRYPQVTDAVLRYAAEHPGGLALFLCGFGQAYLARPQRVKELLEHCAGPLAQELGARGLRAELARMGELTGVGGYYRLTAG